MNKTLKCPSLSRNMYINIYIYIYVLRINGGLMNIPCKVKVVEHPGKGPDETHESDRYESSRVPKPCITRAPARKRYV